MNAIEPNFNNREENTFLFRPMPSSEELWKMYQYFMRQSFCGFFNRSNIMVEDDETCRFTHIYSQQKLYDLLYSDVDLVTGNIEKILKMNSNDENLYKHCAYRNAATNKGNSILAMVQQFNFDQALQLNIEQGPVLDSNKILTGDQMRSELFSFNAFMSKVSNLVQFPVRDTES